MPTPAPTLHPQASAAVLAGLTKTLGVGAFGRKEEKEKDAFLALQQRSAGRSILANRRERFFEMHGRFIHAFVVLLLLTRFLPTGQTASQWTGGATWATSTSCGKSCRPWYVGGCTCMNGGKNGAKGHVKRPAACLFICLPEHTAHPTPTEPRHGTLLLLSLDSHVPSFTHLPTCRTAACLES